MSEDARQYEIDWHFASRHEQLEELGARLQDDEAPPMNTTARDIFDRVKVLARLLVAHRVLRRMIANEESKRIEAERFLERGRAILDELEAQTERGEALCDILGAPCGFEGAVGS